LRNGIPRNCLDPMNVQCIRVVRVPYHQPQNYRCSSTGMQNVEGPVHLYFIAHKADGFGSGWLPFLELVALGEEDAVFFQDLDQLTQYMVALGINDSGVKERSALLCEDFQLPGFEPDQQSQWKIAKGQCLGDQFDSAKMCGNQDESFV